MLLIAVILNIYGHIHSPAPTFRGKLADLLPPSPPGWTMTQKPIASTPEMEQAVAEVLNFDDGIFVDYTRGPERLSVYMAYWIPGKMSHRMIALHTPDVCWVKTGWTKLRESTEVNLHAGNQTLPNTESRCFLANGVKEYVWFWHVVGPNVKSYATGFKPPWYAALTDLWSEGLKQRQEQFFIRLSSDRPLEQMMSGEILPQVLARLPLPQRTLVKDTAVAP